MARESNEQAEAQNQSDHIDLPIDYTGNITSMVNHLINDPNSPYYLHYGDNTGMQIMSVVLNEENYATWSHTVTMALSVKNKE